MKILLVASAASDDLCKRLIEAMRKSTPTLGVLAVYVDDPFEWPVESVAGQARKHGTRWCHLWTDPGNEDMLHAIAEKIGLRRQWFQNRRGFPHYDIVSSKRDDAIRAGAISCSLRSWIEASGVAPQEYAPCPFSSTTKEDDR